MRLLTMGLRLGDELEVITNQNHGQLVIAADCKRYVLGRGLAQKILVRQPANRV
jgi:Fur family ferric uptake transcriptional regulator